MITNIIITFITIIKVTIFYGDYHLRFIFTSKTCPISRKSSSNSTPAPLL